MNEENPLDGIGGRIDSGKRKCALAENFGKFVAVWLIIPLYYIHTRATLLSPSVSTLRWMRDV